MRRTIPISSALVLAGLLCVSRPSAACGGTFCDGSPAVPPMPVDQSGEVIVFAFDGTQVEAHIQIEYTGDPARFAWVVPLPSEPTFTVGSQQLFLNLLNGSVPTFTLTTTVDACGSNPGRSSSSGGGMSCGASGGDDSTAFAGGGNGGLPTDHNAPQVEGHEQVGAFDIVVLRGGPDEVTAWLAQNQYLPDPKAVPLLADYAAKGHLFAAVKLVPGAGVGEIHPLVVRYTGNQPCIPIVLTSIAATENMGIRAFFLGHQRTVPVAGYKLVELAAPRLDWVGLGANYTDAVTRAVDSPIANGHAFVTEYAGDSGVVSRDNLVAASWRSQPFVGLDALSVSQQLQTEGLLQCGNGCVALHPLLPGLLAKYLPAPPGVSPSTYYECQSCYATSADLTAWDGAAFAQDLEERVIAPGNHAVALLQQNPYLTRLFTTISPAEMTIDPDFAELPESTDVSQQLAATQRTRCNGVRSLELSDGRSLGFDLTGAQAVALPAGAPWAETVVEYDAAGQRTLLVDNRQKLDDAVDTANQSVGYSPSSGLDGSDSGCGCTVARRVPVSGLTLGLLAALGMVRRARRARA